MSIWGKKQGFLRFGGQLKPPPPHFGGARLKKSRALQVIEARKWVFKGRLHLLPKNGQKLPILGKKKSFWGLGGHLKAPAP